MATGGPGANRRPVLAVWYSPSDRKKRGLIRAPIALFSGTGSPVQRRHAVFSSLVLSALFFVKMEPGFCNFMIFIDGMREPDMARFGGGETGSGLQEDVIREKHAFQDMAMTSWETL